MVDSIGGYNGVSAVNAQYVNDRTGTASSAIWFNSGYAVLPSGTYFSGDFTITSWVNILSLTPIWPRLIDCGMSNFYTNEVIASVYAGNGGVPTLQIIYNSAWNDLSSNKVLSLNLWYHLAFVLSGTTGSIYINGTFQNSGTQISPPAATRTNCYIGKSNNVGASYSPVMGYYDDLMIFNKALSSTQVTYVMGLVYR